MNHYCLRLPGLVSVGLNTQRCDLSALKVSVRRLSMNHYCLRLPGLVSVGLYTQICDLSALKVSVRRLSYIF